MALLSLGLIIVITLLYPIITFPVVQSVNALISGNDRSPSLSMRRTISLVGMGLALLLDTVVVDMGYVFGLCGSPGLGFLAYVLPCASFLSIMLAKRKAFSVSSVCAVLIETSMSFQWNQLAIDPVSQLSAMLSKKAIETHICTS